MTELFTSDSLISLLTLILLEIVLGVDNVIFVSILLGRLDKSKQPAARRIWMITGMIVRIILLLSLTWLVKHGDKELFNLFNHSFSLRNIIMLAGGLFLLFKTVSEIHQKLEGEVEIAKTPKGANALLAVVIQIILVDMVFSFDSIITAVGMAQHVEIMICAVIIAMIVMFLFSQRIADFIHQHPTLKMLALSFLVMIGCVLIIEGWDAEKAHDLHLKNYVYFSMAFSFGVEMLNMYMRKRAAKPVQLHEPELDKSMKDK